MPTQRNVPWGVLAFGGILLSQLLRLAVPSTAPRPVSPQTFIAAPTEWHTVREARRRLEQARPLVIQLEGDAPVQGTLQEQHDRVALAIRSTSWAKAELSEARGQPGSDDVPQLLFQANLYLRLLEDERMRLEQLLRNP
jgi:hypothetical protein